MRLQEKAKRDITLRPRTGGTDVPIWGAGTSTRAVIQPLGGAVAAQVYGEKVSRMKLMLYDGTETLVEGMGVCVDVAGDQPCDYFIKIPPEPWSGHQRTTLEWISPGRRA